jgi:ABC-2 type transport system permease protein
MGRCTVKLFISNLRMARGGLIAWSALILVYGLFAVYLYPTVAGSTLDYVGYIASMPESMRLAMGLGDMDLSALKFNLDTFVAVEFLMFWPVIVLFYAIFAGVNLSREAERGTLDLLLAQPVSRAKVLLARYGAMAGGVIAIALASLLGITLGKPLIENASLDFAHQSLALLSGTLLVLAVGSYTALFSVIFLSPRKALLAAGGLTAGMYIINFIVPVLTPGLNWLRYLSFFYHYNAVEVARTGELNLAALAVYAGVFVAALFASLVIFQRRNIAA